MPQSQTPIPTEREVREVVIDAEYHRLLGRDAIARKIIELLEEKGLGITSHKDISFNEGCENFKNVSTGLIAYIEEVLYDRH
jgi:hypothetical protein